MADVVVYGIANCDTIKKARAWLNQRGIDYRFHDYRKAGLSAAQLEPMLDQLGWEAMLNRRGTTWRGLPEATRAGIDRDSAAALMLDNPAIIKRPILAHAETLHLGFSEQQYREIFEPS